MPHNNTFSLISQINTAMNDYIIDELSIAGITDIVPSHGAILYALFHKKESSFLGLAQSIGKSQQSITTLVRKLEQLGFVAVKESREDRRTKIAFLTEKGKSFEETFQRISENLYDRQFSNMSKDEAQQLHTSLIKMLNNFSIK